MPAKTPFVAAMQTNDDGHPIAMRLTRLKGFTKQQIEDWAERHLRADSVVVADGLRCFVAVQAAGCEHIAIITGGGPASVTQEAFTWVNTMIGVPKTPIHGTCHAVSERHLTQCQAAFCYRVSRRGGSTRSGGQPIADSCWEASGSRKMDRLCSDGAAGAACPEGREKPWPQASQRELGLW